MKNNKLIGLIIGGVLGFVFVITCTSPVESNTAVASNSGKYQISTNVVQIANNSNVRGYYEVILDTETGEVISRKYDWTNNSDSFNGLFTQIY